MSVLFWTILGFIGGVIVSQNSAGMNHPELAAVFLCMIASCGLMWTLGYRGKSVAVASAVATATANANANARAAASSAVNLYMMSQNHDGMPMEYVGQIADIAVQEVEQSRSSVHSVTSLDKDMA